MPNFELQPMCKFEAINYEFPKVIIQNLSNNHSYLYEMCCSVSNGNCSEGLTRQNPGKMPHSRWLTTANRILRLNISTKKPEQSLQLLVKFIVQVYVPVWFAIKTTPSCKDDAKHVWLTVYLFCALLQEF